MVSSKSASLGEFVFGDSILKKEIEKFILRNKKLVKNFKNLVPPNKKKNKLFDSQFFIAKSCGYKD